LPEEELFNYKTFKEINEIPESIREVIGNVRKIREIVNELNNKGVNELYYIGCGTSHYVAMGSALPLLMHSTIKTIVAPASEFMFYYLNNRYKSRKAVIAFSRSGSTAEILSAMRQAKEKGYVTIGITCTRDSPILKLTDYSILAEKCYEESYVMTKSFVTMQLAGLLLSLYQISNDYEWAESVIKESAKLPVAVEKILSNKQQYFTLAKETLEKNTFIFLGTSITMSAAFEAGLKFKEMTHAFTEALHALEFRHGPIALASRSKEIVLFILAPRDKSIDKVIRLYNELINKGFNVRLVTNSESFKDQLYIDWSGHVYYSPLLFIIPLYLMAFYRTILKGYNPDKPKDLVKVVKTF